jgi:hypothetical protein
MLICSTNPVFGFYKLIKIYVLYEAKELQVVS